MARPREPSQVSNRSELVTTPGLSPVSRRLSWSPGCAAPDDRGVADRAPEVCRVPVARGRPTQSSGREWHVGQGSFGKGHRRSTWNLSQPYRRPGRAASALGASRRTTRVAVRDRYWTRRPELEPAAACCSRLWVRRGMCSLRKLLKPGDCDELDRIRGSKWIRITERIICESVADS